MAEVNETNNARPDDSVGRGNGKKRNPVFFIILGILIIGGGWFGISKYSHAVGSIFRNIELIVDLQFGYATRL